MSQKKAKVIALDFDNCIVLDENTRTGSEELKEEAWLVVFSEHERNILAPALEEAKKIVVGGKGDRKDIVKKICEHFGVPSDQIDAEVLRRCDHFNRVVQESIKTINISKRTHTALADLASRAPLYVNTATPRENVLESMDALGLTQYFKAVLGRPGTKVGNLLEIIAAESIHPEELLFVDDQQGGYLAATEVGCKFAGMHTAKNKLWHAVEQPFPIIHTLDELISSL